MATYTSASRKPKASLRRRKFETKLSHTAVAKNIVKVGRLREGQTFAQDIQLKLDPGTDARNLRPIAFVQEPGQGRVIGAAAQTVGAAVARQD